MILGKGLGLFERFARNRRDKCAAAITIKIDHQIFDGIGRRTLKDFHHIIDVGLRRLKRNVFDLFFWNQDLTAQT